MRLSVVLELLLIFILIAFAASRVIDSKDVSEARKMVQVAKKGERQDDVMNKLCNCTDGICNCCREFHVPILNINGPGCAKLQYVADDNLSVALSIADRVIATQTLSGRKPRPVCMPLPGGYSKFCGRVYNIARIGEDFKACLGLELQSKSTVEASLRVSCFKFGPRGVLQEAAEPLPLATELEDEEDEDDDEDDFGIGSDDDDDDDDDDEDDDDDDFGIGDDEDDDDEEDDAAGSEADDDSDSTDYTGFSYLEDGLGSLFGSESSGTKKPIKKKTGVTPQVAKPVATSVKPPRKTTIKRKPARVPAKKQPLPVTTTKPVTISSTIVNDVTEKTDFDSQATPTKNASGLNLLHTSALIQLANKPDEQNEVGVPSAVLIAADNDASPDSTAQKQTVTNSEKNRPRPNKPEQSISNPEPESGTPIRDPGIQSSISYITGQLSEVPVTTIVSSTKPIGDVADKQKLETSTSSDNVKPILHQNSKPVTATPVNSDDSDEDEDDEGGVVEIVQSFGDDEEKPSSQIIVETIPQNDEASKSTEDADESDSDEGEKSTDEKEDDDSDADDDDDEYDDEDEDDDGENATDKVETGEADKKKKKKDDDDDDLLGFGAISETLGFNFSKEKKTKVKKGSTTNTGLKKKDDDDILSSITDTLGFSRSLNPRNRGRQNKMLKFDSLN